MSFEALQRKKCSREVSLVSFCFSVGISTHVCIEENSAICQAYHLAHANQTIFTRRQFPKDDAKSGNFISFEWNEMERRPKKGNLRCETTKNASKFKLRFRHFFLLSFRLSLVVSPFLLLPFSRSSFFLLSLSNELQPPREKNTGAPAVGFPATVILIINK